VPPKLKKFLLSWLINTLAVLVAVYLVKGLTYQKPLDLLAASLLLGILNTFIKPFLVRLALPLLILSLGLFLLILNGLLLYFVGVLLRPHFEVKDFWSAFWGALVISVVSLVLNTLTGTGNAKIKFEKRQRPPDRDSDDGPVIDI
jgi:putative membrane protein